MKKCLNCNVMNDDDARFCKSCGSDKFIAPNTAKWYSKKQETKETTWSAVDIVKKYGSSNLFSWLSLLFILLAIFEIIMSINSLLFIREIYREFEVQNIHQYDQFLTYFGIVIAASMILTFAVNIALWSGMFKFRESSKMFSNERFEIKGLNIIRISLIFHLVLSALFTLCYILLLNHINSLPFVVNNVLPAYGLEDTLSKSSILVIAFVFEAAYSILLIMTINAVINTAKTEIPAGFVSMFVIVVNFINAFINLLSVFVLKNSQDGILTKVYAAGFAAFYVILSLLLLQYRTEINAYKESFRFENPYLGDNKA